RRSTKSWMRADIHDGLEQSSLHYERLPTTHRDNGRQDAADLVPLKLKVFLRFPTLAVRSGEPHAWCVAPYGSRLILAQQIRAALARSARPRPARLGALRLSLSGVTFRLDYGSLTRT